MKTKEVKKPKEKDYVVKGFSIQKELYEELKKNEKRFRSMSHQIDYILRKYFEKEI